MVTEANALIDALLPDIKTLDEVMRRDGAKVTDTDLEALILVQRNDRARFNLTQAAKKDKKDGVEPTEAEPETPEEIAS
jgi:hypothetical protein